MSEWTKLEKVPWIRGAIFATIGSGLANYGINYYVIGMPVHPVQNAFNNAVSGGISALISSLLAVFVYLKETRTEG
jgi:hypothetical protein